MDVDPVASMRCWAITIEVGGREFEIPALPAAEWWPVLATGLPVSVLDLLTSSEELDEMLLGGGLADDLITALTDAIEEVTGRSSHVAFVLITVAQMHWPVIGGQIAQTGFRWDVQPIAAALDLVYLIALEGMEKDGREKFQALLAGGGKTSDAQKDRITAEFESMAGPRPAPAPLPGKATGGPSDSPRSRTRSRPQQRRQDGPPSEPTPPPA